MMQQRTQKRHDLRGAHSLRLPFAGSAPLCYAVPFAPLNSVTCNGLLILVERVGGKTTQRTHLWFGYIRASSSSQLPSTLIKAARNCHLGADVASNAVWYSQGSSRLGGKSHHHRFYSRAERQWASFLKSSLAILVSRSRTALLQHKPSIKPATTALAVPAPTYRFRHLLSFPSTDTYIETQVLPSWEQSLSTLYRAVTIAAF